MALLDRFRKKTRALTTKKSSRPVVLKLSDKHEPFGSLDIGKVKRILEEEDFGEMQSLFYYMMRDLKISSAVFTRQQQVQAVGLVMDSDNQPFLDWLDQSVDLEQLVGQLTTAIYYGVAVVDVSYTVAESLLVPQFKLIPPRFLHAEKGQTSQTLKDTRRHLYIKQDQDKLFLADIDINKIVFHKHALDIGEITDFSLASKLVWYFSLKHIVLAHNVQYFDNIATPPLIAKTDGDHKTLVDALYDLKSSAMGVFGKDDVVEYLAINSKVDFLAFIDYIDKQIATAILGNTLSTGEGKSGSYAQSKIHENRQKDILRFDAKLLAKTLSAYLNQLERLNFANSKGIKVSFDVQDKKDRKELSDIVKNLTDAGYELDAEQIETETGFKILGRKAVNNTSAAENNTQTQDENNTSFVLSVPKDKRLCSCNNSLPQDTDELDTQKIKTKPIEDALLTAVEHALDGASSYEQAFNSLLDNYPDFDVAALEQGLEKAIANATILASAEITQELKNDR
jgi:phage gp29-like protein